jgi:hypothetical protein
MTDAKNGNSDNVMKVALGLILLTSLVGFFLPGVPREMAAIAAMGSILGLAFMLWGGSDEGDPRPNLQINDKGVHRHWGAGHDEFVAWADLVSVTLQTQATDFATEDYTWVLTAQDGKTASVPHDLADKSGLAELLSHLPGFRALAVEEADGAETDGTFVAWEGKAGDAVDVGSRAEGFAALRR